MRIGVLGTGMVGTAIATKLVELGHEVMLGSRTPDNEKAAEWVAASGAGASQGTFADAAAHGELVFNCTPGAVSLDVLASVRPEDLAGRTLVDVANDLVRPDDGPPVAAVTPTSSLGERIQRTFPEARVVKALNTVNFRVMVDPARLPGEHDLFICGDDDAAKAQVVELLETFGWPRERILDVGGISAARATEAYLTLWIRLRALFDSTAVSVRVVR